MHGKAHSIERKQPEKHSFIDLICFVYRYEEVLIFNLLVLLCLVVFIMLLACSHDGEAYAPMHRVGAVARALASYQCVPGSILGPGVIWGLSFLLVLYSAPRGFSPIIPVFPSPQKPTFLNSNSIWTSGT